jgi:hypothetical protein
MVWKALGSVFGDGLSSVAGCLVIYGGGWYVHLLPKMVNKINAIEYSGGTEARIDFRCHRKAIILD